MKVMRFNDSLISHSLSVAATSRVEGGAEAKAQLQVIGLDLGGAELKGGVDHTRVQRVKFQGPIALGNQAIAPHHVDHVDFKLQTRAG
jgi:hypothetical protein